ncbi:DUF1269 domain-containing protein [Miniphocaeibacter massiliensis]|uniref:DUF1269 domain-containing protein n=1 Tax=Miniphocaeibacter massiliensis TaxID=2041841 RepID=UPI000C1C42BB|nr:DUF1269 domain-containing protein [Miniphocaeibacter massiliensis]
MKYNVLLAKFSVRSEGYEAFITLSNKSASEKYFINQMVLALRKDNKLEIEDIYDSGKDTNDDTILGGILGGIVGIFSGPIGFLLWGSLGALIGSAKDASDETEDMSLLERVCKILDNDEIAIIALIEEDELTEINEMLNKYNAEIVRFDASEVQYEVEKAKELQEELEKETKRKMREERKGARKEKLKDIKEKISDEFKNLKSIVK